MNENWRISRRTMLRGVGAAMALPFLDVMEAVGSVAPPASSRPVRLAYLYIPNGTPDGSWAPKRATRRGTLMRLNRWMRPLEPFKRDIIVPTNMWTPRGNGHGAGTATWLTGGGYDSKRIDAGGVSADQIAARHVGRDTLLPSLELSVRGEGFFSNDLARNTISWAASDRPASREVDPRAVFDRMFRRPGEGAVDRSVLDIVLGHARGLRGRVSASDRRKVDEYLESVRAIERRLDFADSRSREAVRAGELTDSLIRPRPGIPTDHREYVRLMLDMMVLAFWSDATRVCTFMLDHGQSNRYFNFIPGVRGTWHALSHYRDISGKTEDDDGKTSWDSVESKRDMYSAVTMWHTEQVAYLLGRLRQIDDGDGTLLDNSMIVYGSSLADGHEHDSRDLPLLVGGRAGGAFKPGRVVRFSRPTSMSRLHLTLLQRAGADVREFGGATEPLNELGG